MNYKHIWYISYGSNLKRDRFMCYIKGGKCHENGRIYEGCTDKSDPLIDKPVTINHRLYFANYSLSWDGGGVAFIDPQEDPIQITLGRMYLIKESQFEDIHRQEGTSSNWYDKIIELGTIDGYPVMTFTNNYIKPENEPCPRYLRVIAEGIRETYPQMSDDEIWDYLNARKEDKPLVGVM